MDGLDIAACRFYKENNYTFEIVQCTTIPYSSKWKDRLSEAPYLSGEALTILDFRYGKWLGDQANQFCSYHNIKADLIGSHGHTIFHKPEKAYTLQIGNISTLANSSGVSVVADFRLGDVALGGQGAPLVPIGDKLLFPEFDACLNLGGFANISLKSQNTIEAWDICPLNLPLNMIAQKRGKEYDEKGDLGRSGEPIEPLVESWMKMDYFHRPGPKSLGREWMEGQFLPKLKEREDESPENILASLNEFQSRAICDAIPVEVQSVLLSGGGTYNKNLLRLLEAKRPGIWHIPEQEIIDYKEAVVFAFMAWLRWNGKDNILASVTGAGKNHSAGVIYPL